MSHMRTLNSLFLWVKILFLKQSLRVFECLTCNIQILHPNSAPRSPIPTQSQQGRLNPLTCACLMSNSQRYGETRSINSLGCSFHIYHKDNLTNSCSSLIHNGFNNNVLTSSSGSIRAVLSLEVQRKILYTFHAVIAESSRKHMGDSTVPAASHIDLMNSTADPVLEELYASKWVRIFSSIDS